ncbi:collagen alpha-1(XIV) chain-like, partial [Dendronephthya gigantea]|uniref:collagen alpha-1(XIV) chain-like n=1 Tax=Dendronephthya gigantea TaxID=151771 RepID=UPI001069115B
RVRNTTLSKPGLGRFKAIPTKEETAEKLIENFFEIPASDVAKRRTRTKVEDTVVILDSSGSVGNCEFDKGRTALKDMMMISRDNYENYYAGVVYSTTATVNFQFLSASEAAKKMDEFSYEGGDTNTADGLSKAYDLIFDPNSGSHFPSKKMVFLVTDGQSNENQDQTIPNAEDLKSAGVQIYVVAVGDFTNGINEIVDIATRPKKHLFRVKTFGDFLDVVKLVVKRVDRDTYEVVGDIPPPC